MDNQGACRKSSAGQKATEMSERLADGRPQAIGMAAARAELLAALQDHQELAARLRLHFADPRRVDDGGAVDAHETIAEPLLHRPHGLADQVALLAHADRGVV